MKLKSYFFLLKKGSEKYRMALCGGHPEIVRGTVVGSKLNSTNYTNRKI